MSTAGLIDLPQEIFSGEAPFIPAEDLPPGASAGCQDVQFNMGEWATRAGLVSQFTVLGGAPKVNGLATFDGVIQPLGSPTTNPLVVLDSTGNAYIENAASPGILSSLAIGVAKPNSFLLTAAAFTRLYMAFGDGINGMSPAAQYDGTNPVGRFTAPGPGAPPTAADGGADVVNPISA